MEKSKFSVRPGVVLFLHFRIGAPSHLCWRNEVPCGRYDSWPSEEKRFGKKEINNILFLRNENDFLQFIRVLAEMHGVRTERVKVMGDVPGDPSRVIAVRFIA